MNVDLGCTNSKAFQGNRRGAEGQTARQTSAVWARSQSNPSIVNPSIVCACKGFSSAGGGTIPQGLREDHFRGSVLVKPHSPRPKGVEVSVPRTVSRPRVRGSLTTVARGPPLTLAKPLALA